MARRARDPHPNPSPHPSPNPNQNTAVWAPQGPRVLTFFMYLNNPEGGGETWFPQVTDVNGSRGIMVQPRAGSAVLWPSTLDAEPMHADHRTNHAALNQP